MRWSLMMVFSLGCDGQVGKERAGPGPETQQLQGLKSERGKGSERWADATGEVVDGVVGSFDRYIARYYDEAGNAWFVDVETLDVSPVQPNVGAGTCEDGDFIDACLSVDSPSVNSSRIIPPRVTFQLMSGEIRVRKDDSGPPLGGCSGPCGVRWSDTAVVISVPAIDAVAPLHPELAQ